MAEGNSIKTLLDEGKVQQADLQKYKDKFNEGKFLLSLCPVALCRSF